MTSSFDRNKLLKTPQDVIRLAERLAKLPEVTRFDEGEHNEAQALADSFLDLESSFREFLDEILPKLASSEGEELYDLLVRDRRELSPYFVSHPGAAEILQICRSHE